MATPINEVKFQRAFGQTQKDSSLASFTRAGALQFLRTMQERLDKEGTQSLMPCFYANCNQYNFDSEGKKAYLALTKRYFLSREPQAKPGRSRLENRLLLAQSRQRARTRNDKGSE